MGGSWKRRCFGCQDRRSSGIRHSHGVLVFRMLALIPMTAVIT